jgi:hypothetical protein
MSIRFLKVKIKSLSAEARIIRIEELRSRGDLRDALRRHRREDVRREQRATQIAYGYLRGIKLDRIEPNAKSDPDWERIKAMVKKYGSEDQRPTGPNFEAWRKVEIKTAT